MTDIDTTESLPETVILANGEEWTVDSGLVRKGDNVFDLAGDDERADSYLVGQRVLRFSRMNLEAFARSKENYDKASDRRWNRTFGWFTLTMAICLVWIAGTLLYTILHYPNNIYLFAVVGIPPVALLAWFMHGFLPKRRKDDDRDRDHMKQFRQKIIDHRYPDISLNDIWQYRLLADKEDDEQES